MILTVVSFFAVLVLLIIAHEQGHYFTAKAAGVKVEEFGLGYPPRLFGVKWGETVYSLNALPLGGFCKMAGEEDPTGPRSLAGKGIGTRLIVLSAGSLMNALLPLVLLSVAFMLPHDLALGQVMVKEVAPDSPAAIAGIAPGDWLLRVDNKPVRNIGDLNRTLHLSLGEPTGVLVKHADGATEVVRLVPRWKPPAGQGATGITVYTPYVAVVRQSAPFWRAIPMGVAACIQTFSIFKNAIISMVIGAMPFEVAGPVGIAQMSGEAARAGFGALLEFAAFLSINLAIVNLFPIPALDGGRIVFVLLEWVRRGKRIAPRVESLVHTVGFILLIAVILLVTYRDIIRLITGASVSP